MNDPVPRPVSSPAAPASAGKRPWWRLLDRYQWTVFILASLGWMFDTMDQQIFTMSRSISMRDLVPDGDLNLQNQFGGYATTCFILGWATGGLIFGVIGDVLDLRRVHRFERALDFLDGFQPLPLSQRSGRRR